MYHTIPHDLRARSINHLKNLSKNVRRLLSALLSRAPRKVSFFQISFFFTVFLLTFSSKTLVNFRPSSFADSGTSFLSSSSAQMDGYEFYCSPFVLY